MNEGKNSGPKKSRRLVLCTQTFNLNFQNPHVPGIPGNLIVYCARGVGYWRRKAFVGWGIYDLSLGGMGIRI